jgi:hypothetical protein
VCIQQESKAQGAHRQTSYLCTKPIRERRVEARVVRLHVDAPLVVKDKGLILPRDDLVSVQKTPHVMTSPLATSVVPNVTRGVFLLVEHRVRKRLALALAKSDGAFTHVDRLIGHLL